MRKILLAGFLGIMIISSLYLYYYHRWKFLWELEKERDVYPVARHSDGTLRVILIGDSWAEMHYSLQMDQVLKSYLAERLECQVEVASKGKGGMRSRGIYNLMFKETVFGTKQLISSGADYCIVFAGINDASANLGTRQFCHYIQLIIRFLLSNHVRPVIVEAPDVNIGKLFWRRPFKNLAIDYMRSMMTGCGMYHYAEYREALKKMLVDEDLMDDVVYVDVGIWNETGSELDKQLFLDDQLHLNRAGYERMDSSIATAIAEDYKKRCLQNK